MGSILSVQEGVGMFWNGRFGAIFFYAKSGKLCRLRAGTATPDRGGPPPLRQ